MKQQQLTLILPCFKPAPRWIDKVQFYYKNICERLPDTDLFLVVVNDGTPEMVSDTDIKELKKNIHLFSYYTYSKNMGKGYALRYAIGKETTDSVIYTDVDMPYTISSVCDVASLLATHDAVIGIKSKNYYSSVPFWRKKISKWLRGMIGVCFPGIVTTDTQCGLKGLKGQAKDIFLKSRVDGYLFDLEFVADISRNKNITVALHEIELRKDVKFSKISISSIFRELVSFFKIVLISKGFYPKKYGK